jgi:hypothetical protein
LPIAKRKLKIWRFSKTEDSMERWSASLSLVGKIYGIKARCYWEHIGNLKRTCWEQMEKWKQSSKRSVYSIREKWGKKKGIGRHMGCNKKYLSMM